MPAYHKDATSVYVKKPTSHVAGAVDGAELGEEMSNEGVVSDVPYLLYEFIYNTHSYIKWICK